MNLLLVILVLVNFLKTIGIIIIVYYLFKFVGRLLFPIVIKKAVDNLQARQNPYTAPKPEGEVTIEKDPKQKGRYARAEGEYVDFEEID